jgi:DNA-directed RNA polymerase subunit RPC12/RpoP
MDEELTAQKKYACAMCGGEARWDPAKQALVCAYCGSAMPAKMDEASGAIQEHDLVVALRQVPDDQRGWETETHSVRCQSCKAITVFQPGRVAQRCDFCGSSALVDYQELRPPIRPESLLPFKISESQLRDAARQWYQSRWFAPNKLKKAALTDQVHGFYLPFWTFDAQAHCPWTAEAGYHYYVTESYADSNGKSQTRQVQRTRWEPVSGVVNHFFDDKLVAASKGVPADLIAKIEPFPTLDQLAPYDPGYLSGWVVEQYQIDLGAAADHARKLMDDDLESMCASEVPGDTHRSLSIHPEYSGQTYKHVLLPVWVLSYNYLGTVYQMLINGYTGKIAGRYPKSWIKITLLVLAIAIVVIIIYSLAQGQR